MPANKPQASRSIKGEGKRIRRARNIIRRMESKGSPLTAVQLARYSRAKAVLVYHGLLNT